MKLCDRCFKAGDYVKSVDSVNFQNTEEVFDLCESCSQIAREFCIGKRPGKAFKETEGNES